VSRSDEQHHGESKSLFGSGHADAPVVSAPPPQPDTLAAPFGPPDLVFRRVRPGQGLPATDDGDSRQHYEPAHDHRWGEDRINPLGDVGEHGLRFQVPTTPIACSGGWEYLKIMVRTDEKFHQRRLRGRFVAPVVVVAGLGLAAIAVIAICAGLTPRTHQPPTTHAGAQQAKQALDRSEFAVAYRLAREAAAQSGVSVVETAAAWNVAAEAAARQDRIDDAVECFDQIVQAGGTDAALAHGLIGDLLAYRQHRLGDAETRYRRALELDANQAVARLGLLTLLVAEGRRREAVPLLIDMARAGTISEQQLLLLGNSDWVVETFSYRIRPGTVTANRDEFLEAALAAVPDDHMPSFGLARLASTMNNTEQAIELLSEVVESEPLQHEARGRLGELLSVSDDSRRFLEWHEGVPREADVEPLVWFARGTWARRAGKDDVAARCFWECLARDPNHLAANLQLAQALDRLDRRPDAEPFRVRSRQLSEFGMLLRGVAGDPRYGETTGGERIQRLAELAEQLGRFWESLSWCRVAGNQDARLNWPHIRLERIGTRLTATTPQTIGTLNPARQIDLSDLPLPDWSSAGHPDRPAGAAAGSKPVGFEDDAAAAGLVFSYFSDASQPAERTRLPETIGGGAGVLDANADGWPDVYLPQGCVWSAARHSAHRDRLFVNTGDGRFVDVTDQALPPMTGYGQGVTVGDINADGFDDLYVANVGGNRLLVNNGDGTYSDATAASGTAGDDWSVSCVLADLDGDSLPDLYVVNYLAGDDVFRRGCPPGAIPGRPCGPGNFAAAQDRLYLNTGDGRFVDVTATSGVEVAEGKGLGVIAADLDGSGRVSLFVANDTRPNFLFVNTSQPGAVSFAERGLVSGLAFNANGESESCMGIALGDVDGDGRLDLFVTNYTNQSNTLYSPIGHNQFTDRTRRSGLRDGGYSLMGWGTEFLDADLDGRLDLLVTNGHLRGYVNKGGSLEMPAQFYRNIGDGRFVEAPAAQLGPYFSGRHVGRGLARIDWNRDGRDDALVTHLDAPLALLTNRTATTAHFLALRLVGTRSNRDAITTTVRVIRGEQAWTAQLTAGDGYLVSNQRQLIFGLGPVDRVDRLEITWPSGLTEELTDVAVDRELVVIEGRGGWPLPRVGK